MNANSFSKNIHLLISALIIIIMGCIYGVNPEKTLPFFFDFNVKSIDLKNVFRAMMGLYFALACFWIYGIMNTNYWQFATLSVILFMGGLALGRSISLVIDGISIPYFKGLILEFFLMLWGIYNLKKYKL